MDEAPAASGAVPRSAAAAVARAVHELTSEAHEPREVLDALHRLAGAAVDERLSGEARGVSDAAAGAHRR